jgi:hypothetical protein
MSSICADLVSADRPAVLMCDCQIFLCLIQKQFDVYGDVMVIFSVDWDPFLFHQETVCLNGV